MKIVLLALFVALNLCIHAQEMNCKKFKTGYFQNVDHKDGDLFIKRTNKFQFETDKVSGVELKLKVTWINDCTYKLQLISGNDVWNSNPHLPSDTKVIVQIIETGEDYYIQVSKIEGIDDIEYRSKIQIVR